MWAGGLNDVHVLSDWGEDGGFLFCYQPAAILPHDQKELIAYLALTDSLDTARRYVALAE